MTAGTEIFQGKSQQVARGLNTISSRISKNEKALAEYGVAIKDGNGNLRSTYDILADLAPKWETMSNTEQVALGNTLAGTNQYKIFAAVMSNFNTAIEANITALSSQGSATKENEAYMESLQAKITNLKSAFTEVVLGEGGLNTFLKNLVDAGTGIVKFIGYGNNLVAILTTIGGVLVAINSKVIALKIDSIITWVSALTTSIKQGLGNALEVIKNPLGYILERLAEPLIAKTAEYVTGVEVATTANEAFAISTQGIVSAIGLVTSAISIGVMAYNKYKQTQEQNAQEARDNLKSYRESADKYKELKKYLSDTNLSEKELNTILQNNTDIFGEYTEAIKGTTEEREKYLKILKKQNAEEAASTYRESVGEVKEATQRATEGTSLTGYTTKQTSLMKGRTGIDKLPEYEDVTKAKGLNAQIDALQKYQDKLQEVNNEIGKGDLRYNSYQTAINRTSAEIKKLTEQQKQDKETLEDANIAYEIGKENLGAYSNTNKEANKALNKLNGTTKESATATQSKAEAEEKAEKIAEAVAQAQKNLSNVLKDTNSATKTVEDAYKEYQEAGQLSLDTYNELINLSPDYLGALMNENGQIVLNKDSLANLSEVMKQQAIQSLQAAASADILAYANNQNADMSKLAQAALDGAGNAAVTAGEKATQGAGGFNTLATEVLKTNGALEGKSEEEVKNITAGALKIQQAYANLAKSIGTISISTNTNTKSTRRNTSANSKATKAKKALTEANKKLAKSIEKVSKQLEKEKQKLEKNIDKWEQQSEDIENVFSIIENRLQNRIDLLNDEKDALEAEKDARTEQLETEKTLAEETLEAEEKAFDKQYESRKSQLEAEEKAEKERYESRKSQLEAEEKAEKALLQTQIDSVENRISIIDDEISKQKEANDTINDAIELQQKLEALQKAKATKVKTFKDGQWTYGVDESAVDEAQQALDEYNRQKAQEQAIKNLENQKSILEEQKNALQIQQQQLEDRFTTEKEALETEWDSIKERIDNSKEALETEKDIFDEYIQNQTNILETERQIFEEQLEIKQQQLEEEYQIKLANDEILNNLNSQINSMQSQVEQLENQKSQVEAISNQYQDIVDNQLLIQYLGTSDIFGTEGLKNNVIPTLKKVENNYISIQQEIEETTKQVEKLEAAIDKLDELEEKTKGSSKKVSKSKVKKQVKKIVASVNKKHADGVARVQSNEIALVGDSPDTELVVGSKVNEGVTTMLPKGSGVVNAKSLNTLAGILNNVGAFSSSNFGAGNGIINNSSQENSTNINIGNLNVQTDKGEELVNYLQDFALKMKQKSY